MTDCFMFVCFMLGPLFFFSSEAGTYNIIFVGTKTLLLPHLFQMSVCQMLPNASLGFASYCARENLVWLRKDAIRGNITSVKKVRFNYRVKEFQVFFTMKS